MGTSKKLIMDGACFSSLIASGRSTNYDRQAGYAFFIYAFMSYALWRRIRDNINAQLRFERMEKRDIAMFEEMKADGFIPADMEQEAQGTKRANGQKTDADLKAEAAAKARKD